MAATTSRLDAHALLTSQGWRGHGHSLHPTSDSTGLKHHLLIKREGTDGAGLGSKKDHKAEAWWMNAFDQALKGIDTSSGSMKQKAGGGALDLDKITARGRNKYVGARGLYTCFVKGGRLNGTAELDATGLPTPPDSGVATPADTGSDAKAETKEERRARREAKRQRKAEKAARKEAEAKAAAKAAKKADKKKAKEALKAGETKAERKARREARRARKEQKRRQKKSTG